MALQNNATVQMVQNVVNGTTPPKEAQVAQALQVSYVQLSDGTYNLVFNTQTN